MCRRRSRRSVLGELQTIIDAGLILNSTRYPDVKEMEILTLKKYYNECAEERKAILGRVVKGELPHCEDIVEAMMNFTK